MIYSDATARRESLDRAASEAGTVLKRFPSGPMGLTPDSVKASPEWRAARRAYDIAFGELRRFNAWYVKTFAAKLRAERQARRP